MMTYYRKDKNEQSKKKKKEQKRTASKALVISFGKNTGDTFFIFDDMIRL